MNRRTFSHTAAIALAACLWGACSQDEATKDPVFTTATDDIYAAAAEGDVKTGQRIITEGKWDYGAADDSGKRPLDYAVENGNPQIVEMMLQAGANPNIVNREGRTLLQVAQDKGHKEAVALLKKYGARE